MAKLKINCAAKRANLGGSVVSKNAISSAPFFCGAHNSLTHNSLTHDSLKLLVEFVLTVLVLLLLPSSSDGCWGLTRFDRVLASVVAISCSGEVC